MNKLIEDMIVNAFFTNPERAKYELASNKKRWKYIFSLRKVMFRERYLKKIEFRVRCAADIYNLLQTYHAPDLCYIISMNENIDGREMPLFEALEETVFDGPVLVSCIHGKLAYFGEEQEYGSPDRYLLIK